MFNFKLEKNNKVRFFMTVFLSLLGTTLLTISVGFSALNQNLNVSGDVDYEKYNNTLYGVLKKEAEIGTYAQEYTGDHRDSFTGNPTKNIYHWYAKSNNADTILDKWNVIFGGFCWQMLRTTDTGGVKLIYNREVVDGVCDNTGEAQQIGKSKFNANYDSLADAGYMYNTRYVEKVKTESLITSTNILAQTAMTGSSDYYYGTEVTYDSSTNEYSLVNVTQATWNDTYTLSRGLYTCQSTTDTSCSTVYYIVAGSKYYMYGFTMTDGNLLNYYNTNITFGAGYTDNNGTYTLTNTTTMLKSDWYSNYSAYKNYYTCGGDFITCTSLNYIPATFSYYYNYINSQHNYIYGNSFTYDSSVGKYILSTDRYKGWNVTVENMLSLATHHYTCFNTTGECRTLSYIFYVSSPYGSTPRTLPNSNIYIYYVDLKSGKNIEDAINEMLYNDNVNTTNSTIKTYIDDWYQNNMTSYTDKLEDIIFCNNRSQTNASATGWNPNGGNVEKFLYYDYDSLVCENDTDKFSIANNKAKLTYPVGLAGYKEMSLLYGGSYLIRKTGQAYWLLASEYFTNVETYGHHIDTTGNFGQSFVASLHGVRPVVSLKPGTEYASGTGSMDDPYIVE